LANIANLSVEELNQLLTDLRSAFDLADDNGASNDDLLEIADAIDSVNAEADGRTERQGIRDRAHLSETPTEDGATDEADEAEEDDEPVVEDVGDRDDAEPLATVDEDQAPVVSSARPSLDAVGAAAGNRGGAPANPLRVTTHLVAAGDVRGFSVGQEIPDSMALATAMVRKLRGLGRAGSPDNVLVASLMKEFPEERTLGEDPYENDEKIQAVMANAQVASGGICEPMAVDYSIDTIGSTARPLQSGLPSYAATRGGVKFTVPPSLADATPPDVWTITDDENAESDTQVRKTCFRIECVDPVDATVYGIPVCIEVGNMMGKFTPEIVNAQIALTDVAAARMAELTMLDQIDAGSTAVTSTGVLGTVRTILPTLDLLNAGYRYRYRLGTSTLRWVLPQWVHEECRADLAMELAHDNAPFSVTDAQIDAYFTARNVRPIWMLEDKAGAFNAPQAAGPINPWPATFAGYLFAEGTWQALDGGQIDLGVVRDSTLNAKNDYQIWREDFEGVAKRGNESLKVTITTKPTGMSAGTKDTSV
jgi:hypothetical protein